MPDLIVRPAQLPEFRAALIDYLMTPRARAQLDRFGGRPLHYGQQWNGKSDVDANDLHRQEVEGLQAAVLFHVSEAMTRLAVGAAPSLPDFSLERFDLPAEVGFIYFAEPIALYRGPNGQLPSEVVACRWDSLGSPGSCYVWLSFYSHWHGWLRDARAAGQLDESTLSLCLSRDHALCLETFYGRPLGSTAPDYEEPTLPRDIAHKAELDALSRVICAAWLLLGQPLARMSEVAPDRAARRRLQRQGHDQAAARVIELRRPAGAAPGASEREYHHQWIVRGHWRQQACGPGRAERRPTWITPHVKGPEGAPMLGGEKVYSWKR